VYEAARVYSEVAAARARTDAQESQLYVERAISLLKRAIADGYDDYGSMRIDESLDALRPRPEFDQLLGNGRTSQLYCAQWWPSDAFRSTGFHGLNPREHLRHCEGLIRRGYRPASLSVALFGKERVAASVWHLPLVPDERKEKLALQQVNVALALLKMKQARRVWPLLAHRPDPRLRSYLIHRFSPSGVAPAILINRLDSELEQPPMSDVDWSMARALLLALGEYAELTDGERERLTQRLVRLFEEHPDPGLHAAAEWLLTQWDRKSRLRDVNMKLATAEFDGERRWYVTRQGQTMVVLDARHPFTVGSPSWERNRTISETLHRCRIDRQFAIANREVTVEQFRKFDPDFGHQQMHRYPYPDCPVGGVTWYECVAYCNWLNQQEGIPEQQWCYMPNENGKYQAGMRLAPDCLKRTGYRLPTEAEWEFACRAGAGTARYYGETEALLGEYATFGENSRELTCPAGKRKPNDFGLFDMHGNLWNWCNNTLVIYSGSVHPCDDVEEAVVVRDTDRRVTRGGGFSYGAGALRSASRGSKIPSDRGNNFGFRLARTLPTSLAPHLPTSPSPGSRTIFSPPTISRRCSAQTRRHDQCAYQSYQYHRSHNCHWKFLYQQLQIVESDQGKQVTEIQEETKTYLMNRQRIAVELSDRTRPSQNSEPVEPIERVVPGEVAATSGDGSLGRYLRRPAPASTLSGAFGALWFN
jgi:formylglycine-generating enzyme required for sulfatase activity